jgi:hypothetical protein
VTKDTDSDDAWDRGVAFGLSMAVSIIDATPMDLNDESTNN